MPFAAGAPQPDPIKTLIEAQAALLDKQKQVQEALFDKGMTYSKLILSIGYASLIAIWSGTRQYLSPQHTVWAALLFLVSIAAYVAFEVGSMLYLTYYFRVWQNEIRTCGNDLAGAINNYNKRQRKTERTVWFAWVLALILSIPTGFGAAGVLIYGFVRKLSLGS